MAGPTADNVQYEYISTWTNELTIAPGNAERSRQLIIISIFKVEKATKIGS